MKNIFTILFSILLISYANAQNSQETLKWLKKQKASMEDVSSNSVQKGKLELTDSYIKVSSNKNGEKSETVIYWSKIESIRQTLHDSGRYHININPKDEEYTNIRFIYSGDGFAIVDKLAHMANLNGTDVTIERSDFRGYNPRN